MIFPLRSYPTTHPVPSLGGATVRWKPVVPLTVIGPGGQVTRSALVDTGSDDVVLPANLTSQLGIDLSRVAQRQARGVGGSQAVGLFYAPVILLLSDQVETYRWRAVVAFTHAPLRIALFGIAGGLEHFRTTLDIVDRELLMFPKQTLPATQDAVP